MDNQERVNHPAHYNPRENSMETIDEMVLIFGIHDTMAFCKLNAWKYRARSLYKNGEEDMKNLIGISKNTKNYVKCKCLSKYAAME